jgi:ribose transport system substrate-binding protein
MNRNFTSTAWWLPVLLVSLTVGCFDNPPESKPGTSDPGQKNAGAPAAKGTKRIVFMTNGDDPFWDALLSGLKEGEKTFDLAAMNLKAERDVNNATEEGQITRLQQYASSSDIAAVAISVIKADNPAIADEMRKLQKKGIPVITVDSDTNREQFRDARTYYIGTDNIVGGRALGTAAKKLLEEKGVKEGKYVQFAGFTDVDNARARMDGVEESLGAAYKNVDRMPDQMDRNKARDNVRSALTNHADVAALIGIWAYNAPAIAEVVEERKLREQVVVATFDAQAAAIDKMDKGQIDVMVVQNPFDMGVQTVRVLKAMLLKDDATLKKMFPNAGKPDGDIYTTGLRVVVPGEASPVKAELFDPKVVEYMTLPQFKEWLAKYGLTSS